MATRRRVGVVNLGRSAGRLEREVTKMPVGRVTDEVRCGGHPWPSRRQCALTKKEGALV